jgi:hypothetical protein
VLRSGARKQLSLDNNGSWGSSKNQEGSFDLEQPDWPSKTSTDADRVIAIATYIRVNIGRDIS